MFQGSNKVVTSQVSLKFFFYVFSIFIAGLNCTSPKFNGFNTMDPRRTPKMNQNKKFYRKSSLPLDNNTLMVREMTRTERIQVVLDCTHGSGLCLSMNSQTGSGFIVTKIVHDAVADRSGCIQKGDRIVSVNKLYNLDIHLIRQIMRDTPTGFHQPQNVPSNTHWVELEIEFEMMISDDSARGIFNIKLMKGSRNSGLGITVNGEVLLERNDLEPSSLMFNHLRFVTWRICCN